MATEPLSLDADIAHAQGKSVMRGIYAWWPLAGVCLIAAVAAVSHLQTVLSLLVEWGDTDHRTYTHGYLVAGISAWLLLRDRVAIASIERRTVWAALPIVLLCSLLSVVVQQAGIAIGHQLLLPVIVLGGVYTAFGKGVLLRCLLPIAYLYFAIPIWSHFNGLLQQLTILAVRVMLRLTSIPAYFAGDRVEIPDGVFEIAGGCSGLHFLIVALALGALYGQLQGDNWTTRMRHLLLAGFLAVLGNWVRVYVIILAGHLTEMQTFLVTVDHYYFGWLVFAVAMAVFLSLSRDSGKARVVEERQIPVLSSAPKLAAVSVIAVILAIGAPSLAVALAMDKTYVVPAVVLPTEVEGWSRLRPVASDWKPVFVGADSEGMALYRAGERPLEAYVAAYAEQRQGKELLGFENSLTTPFRELGAVRYSNAQVSLIERVVVDGDGREWLLWSYYTVGSRTFASGLVAALWYGTHALIEQPDSRVTALRTPCLGDCAGARQFLGGFMEHAGLLSGQSAMDSGRD